MVGLHTIPAQVRALLLEDVHPLAVTRLREAGFEVRLHRGGLDQTELAKALEGVHVLGIRSKTNVTAETLDQAPDLMVVGAFCIGTNQIDLDAAMRRSVPVFNAPFSNTRSVAELVLADIIMLFRRLFDKIHDAHQGQWNKSTAGSIEVRGKTLGIVGYGHIGRQVSVLAEALGMRVVYFDIADKLSMGNAVRAVDLRDLLEQADIVTLHVPATPETEGMIGDEQIAWMRRGTYLINTSRGSVVDLHALRGALDSGHIAGAAVDVFPEEPKSGEDPFSSPLQGLPNVVLTPHIGGATEEAQRNIGIEVAGKLVRYVLNGSSEGAVNFPNVVLPEIRGRHRILHAHRNVPGVLQQVNAMFAQAGINISAQHMRSHLDVGYLIADVDAPVPRGLLERIAGLPETIAIRALS